MIEDHIIPDASGPMPITVRVHEACRLTGIGRSKLYELIAAGEVDIIKVGTITLVPIAWLTGFLHRFMVTGGLSRSVKADATRLLKADSKEKIAR